MDIPFSVAEMVALPVRTPVAIPLALTMATDMSLEAQLTEPEILPVVPSEKPPVAVKVVFAPEITDAVRGAIVIAAFTVAAVTVKALLAEVTPPYMVPLFTAAVMLTIPTALPVTTPVPGSTLAVAGAADDHVTRAVISAVVPSE